MSKMDFGYLQPTFTRSEAIVAKMVAGIVRMDLKKMLDISNFLPIFLVVYADDLATI